MSALPPPTAATSSLSASAAPPHSAGAAVTAAVGSTATAAEAGAAAAARPLPPPAHPKPRDPRLDHLTYATYELVYEPVEDSYLLMDALYEDLTREGGPRFELRVGAGDAAQDRSFKRCLEIGPGSGIIISYLAILLRRRGYFLAVDVNPDAALTTQQSMRSNGVPGDVLQGNLADCLGTRMRHSIDVLVFNPPYVPTPPEELLGTGISRSWAGGERGREVLDQLLPEVQHLLSPTGVLYCVLLACNDPAEVAAILRAQGGFHAHQVLRRRAGPEDLQVVRFWRPNAEELASMQQQEATQQQQADS